MSSRNLLRRRHLTEVDGSSPFARDRFSLLSPEAQEAVIAKRRAQRLAAEALDAQLADRSNSPQRQARWSPGEISESREFSGNVAGASSLSPASTQGSQDLPHAHSQLDSRPVQRLPDRSPTSDDRDVDDEQPQATQVAWWHEPEARRRSPPPRRRSGRELLRDPEESLLREAERMKKLEVGEALRAQMQERAQKAGSPGLLRRTPGVVEVAVPNSRSDENPLVDKLARDALRQSAEEQPQVVAENKIANNTWQDISVFHERLARVEYHLGRNQASQRSTVEFIDIDTLVQEVTAEMTVIHDAHKTLNADLDDQVQFLAHLDQSVKSLQAQIAPSERHDIAEESSDYSTQGMISLRHDVDHLLAERRETKNAADLEVRLTSVVDELRHELAENVSTATQNTAARDELVSLVEGLNRVQEKQSNDHMLLAEQVAKLESQIAKQAGRQLLERPLTSDGDDMWLQSIESEAGTISGMEELRQDMEEQFKLSIAALDEVSKRLSEVDEELASARSTMLSRESMESIVGRLQAISTRVETLEQTKDDNPSITELSDKLNEVVEKQWDLDQSDATRALEDSVQACIQDTADTASQTEALSQQVSTVSRRVEVLEQGREVDLALLSEKLNGVEEKSWDEQALLAEQIATLESKLAVTPGAAGL